MDQKEVAALKEQVNAEFEQRMQELRNEFNKKMEAIDIVAGITFTLSKESFPQEKIKTISEVSEQPFSMTQEEMFKIMDDCPEEFSKYDGKRIAAVRYPDLDFSRNARNVWHNSIIKKKDNLEIEEIKKGSGRIPAKYRKTSNYRRQDEISIKRIE